MNFRAFPSPLLAKSCGVRPTCRPGDQHICTRHDLLVTPALCRGGPPAQSQSRTRRGFAADKNPVTPHWLALPRHASQACSAALQNARPRGADAAVWLWHLAQMEAPNIPGTDAIGHSRSKSAPPLLTQIRLMLRRSCRTVRARACGPLRQGKSIGHMPPNGDACLAVFRPARSVGQWRPGFPPCVRAWQPPRPSPGRDMFPPGETSRSPLPR